MHCHDHPWGAVATLGAIKAGQCLLQRVVALKAVSKVLHSLDLPAIAGKQQLPTLVEVEATQVI